MSSPIHLPSTSKIPLSERFKLVQQTALIKKHIEPASRPRRSKTGVSGDGVGGIQNKNKKALNRQPPIQSRLGINKSANPKRNKDQISRTSRQRPALKNQRSDQHMKNRGIDIARVKNNKQNKVQRPARQNRAGKSPQTSNQPRSKQQRSNVKRQNQQRPLKQSLQRSSQLLKSKRLSFNTNQSKGQLNRPGKRPVGKQNQQQGRPGQGAVRLRRNQNPRARNQGRKRTDKGSLDKDLDTYMAKTRSQLDADLEAYMSSKT